MQGMERILLAIVVFASAQGIAKNQDSHLKTKIKKIITKYNQSTGDYKKTGPIAVFEALKEHLDENQRLEFYKAFSISNKANPVDYDDVKNQFTSGNMVLQVVSYFPNFYLAGPGGEQAFWKGQSLADARKRMEVILNGSLEDIEHSPTKTKTSFWNPFLKWFHFIERAEARAAPGDGAPWFALGAALAGGIGATQPSPPTNDFLNEQSTYRGHLSAAGYSPPPSTTSMTTNGLGGHTNLSCPVSGVLAAWNEETSTSYINGCCSTWMKSPKNVELVSRTDAGMAPPVPTANPISSPKRIIIHETESEEDSPVSSIQNMHREKGWGDVGYNYIIGKDPNTQEWKIYAGRVAPGNEVGLPLIGSHAKGVNSDSIGIALMGDYRNGKIPDPAAVSLLGQLVGNLKAGFPSIGEVNSHGLEGVGAEAAIPGHTDCPGKGCLHIVRELNNCIQQAGNFSL